MKFENLLLVNYCHPDCVPLKNIMRLPKEEAFAMAKKWRRRIQKLRRFIVLLILKIIMICGCGKMNFCIRVLWSWGGEPEENHPLSFVIEGSDYLRDWFGNGTQTKLFLRDIDARHISFTLGDSGAMFQKNGFVELLTLGDLKNRLGEFEGNFDDFLKASGCHYVEVQLWSDKYCKYVD